MANIFYKIDGDYCYLCNQRKDGYTLYTRSGITGVCPRKIAIIELTDGKFTLPADSAYLFDSAYNTTYNDMDKWDTSDCTEMEFLFFRNASLTSVDLSNFNTSKVKSMYSMFSQCDSLRKVDCSTFDLSSLNKNHLASMFYGCDNLEVINICNWDMSRSPDPGFMFSQCPKLKYIVVDDDTDWSQYYSTPEVIFGGDTSLPNWDGVINTTRANVNWYFTGKSSYRENWNKYKIFMKV